MLIVLARKAVLQLEGAGHGFQSKAGLRVSLGPGLPRFLSTCSVPSPCQASPQGSSRDCRGSPGPAADELVAQGKLINLPPHPRLSLLFRVKN